MKVLILPALVLLPGFGQQPSAQKGAEVPAAPNPQGMTIDNVIKLAQAGISAQMT